MRYEKPIVIDLSQRARTVSGEPNSCYAGTTPGEDFYLCETGGVPYTPAQSCGVGPAPGTGSSTMCISGVSVLSLCESGAGGFKDNYCTVGPSA
jgi:hypothetical protein